MQGRMWDVGQDKGRDARCRAGCGRRCLGTALRGHLGHWGEWGWHGIPLSFPSSGALLASLPPPCPSPPWRDAAGRAGGPPQSSGSHPKWAFRRVFFTAVMFHDVYSPSTLLWVVYSFYLQRVWAERRHLINTLCCGVWVSKCFRSPVFGLGALFLVY